MSFLPIIVASHSDEVLKAEVAFWAASAGYGFVDANEVHQVCAQPDAAAIILELSEHGPGNLDSLEQIAKVAKGKIIAVTTLDAKTLASIRRLLETKAPNVIVVGRGDFTTRLLADLLNAKPAPTELNRDILASAIRDGYVIAHYQPKVPFQPDNEKYGVEALCRIEHPVLGTLYPDSFISLAEAHDLILELTDAVTVHAFRSLATWDRSGLKLRLAINISPRLMSDTAWFERFQLRCQEFDIEPSRITLEVTESSSQGGKVLALEILSRLRLKGFLLSIDDFGTGFSSLETLYKLPFGELKIDKGFVFDLQKNEEARALIESTILLARKLGLRICAEGVETQQVFDELRLLQCDDAQGYHISKPLPADRIVSFFDEWAALQRSTNIKATPPSKFSSVHSLVASLLANDDGGDDATIVLSSPSSQLGPPSESAQEIASGIPALMMCGNNIAALALIHRAIGAAHQNSTDRDLRNKLEHVRTELELALAPSGDVMLRSGERTVFVHAGISFTIGRHSPSAVADIAIACRWMSRGEKNLRVFVQGSSWYLEDLGSTNGHFIDNQRMTPFRAHRLGDGETLVEIGKSGATAAPAWLLFRVTPEGALHLSFGTNHEADQAPNNYSCTEWIIASEAFGIGRSATIALVVPECDAEVEADIGLRNGTLWVTPRSGNIVRLDDSEFSRSVPLVYGSVLALGNSCWAVHEPPSLTGSPPALAASA